MLKFIDVSQLNRRSSSSVIWLVRLPGDVASISFMGTTLKAKLTGSKRFTCSRTQNRFALIICKETVKFGERDAVVKGIVSTGKDLERELQVNLNGTTKQTLNQRQA